MFAQVRRRVVCSGAFSACIVVGVLSTGVTTGADLTGAVFESIPKAIECEGGTSGNSETRRADGTAWG